MYREKKLDPFQKLLKAATYVLVISFIVILSLMPFVWGLVTSLKANREILSYPPKFFGFTLSMEHYIRVFKSEYFGSMLITIFYAAATIISALIIGLMVAYAIKRCSFPGRRLLFYLVICCIPLSIGSAALIIPNYVFFSRLGFTNHLYTLVILYIAYNLPMAIWILIGGIEGIPYEIEESMIIDGVSRVYIVFNMTPRLCLPSIAAASLFIFIGVWNNFILGAVMVTSGALRPIQVSIYNFMGYYGREWGPLAASATASVIPILIVFSFLGKLMVSGLTSGSVKG